MFDLTIDNTMITPGIYKKSTSGLVTVWDIRMKSSEKYLDSKVIHTIEHTMYDYLRNRCGKYRILNVSPTGDQTGFTIVTRFIGRAMIYELIVDYIFNLQRMISVPGANRINCSHHQLHDLCSAKYEMILYYEHWLKFQKAAMNYID